MNSIDYKIEEDLDFLFSIGVDFEGAFKALLSDGYQITREELSLVALKVKPSKAIPNIRNKNINSNKCYLNKINKKGSVYFISCNKEFVKIGETQNLEKRISNMKTSNPYELVLEKEIFTKGYLFLEKIIHKYYSQYRVSGEWFHYKVISLFEKEKEIINNQFINFMKSQGVS